MATTALTAGFLTTFAAPTASADDAFASVPQSDSLGSAPVVASGRFTTSTGTPVTGAEFVLSALPAEDALDTAPEGATLNQTLITRDTTDANGSYSLRVPDATALTAEESSGGLIDFMVFSADHADQLPYVFTRRLVSTPSGYELQVPDLDAAVAPGVGGNNLVAPAATVSSASPETVNFGRFDILAANATATAPSDPDPADTADNSTSPLQGGGGGCGISKVKDYTKRKVDVGQWFSNTGGVNSKFTYTSGASTSLGIGVSASGKYGSFSAKSTNTKDSTADQSYAKVSGSGGWIWRTYFKYGKFFVACNTAPDSYLVKAEKWLGGDPGVFSASMPSGINSCVPEKAGDSFTKLDTKAITWSNGVSIAKIIGIDLSSETGYSHKAKLDINYTADHQLCGRGGYPGQTPYVLAAKS